MEGGEGVPGVWDEGGSWEGYTGVLPRHLPVPIFSLFPALRPTYGQMKAISMYSMRFPKMGLEWVPETSRIDPESTLQTGPEMALRSTLRLVPR